MFERFFKPKWQNANPAVRLEAIGRFSDRDVERKEREALREAERQSREGGMPVPPPRRPRFQDRPDRPGYGRSSDDRRPPPRR